MLEPLGVKFLLKNLDQILFMGHAKLVLHWVWPMPNFFEIQLFKGERERYYNTPINEQLREAINNI